ncbi:hypothetical protein A3D77_00470 [Candidatus Gottesmanbacteria bacterium RIFCSPHIGHO2_02_FULL_39_11]|uniref:Uncharacterized protein n=1 Tax=Candidatus Gottesmanbacteria bacterium RIFCSPHIGHO2_02_FULL_39_11 TaxID=1798382 RepID=A0A1F5ZM51_9BACT|nr:MAG: hypothetical protein A3D77_00470 [Candidatus Gottesmanbacteria bacterium RIFCSPHIGHO2_02_FULL_39_11]
MNKQDRAKLSKSYTKYRKLKAKKRDILRFFRVVMPEIIFRTTKLEGDPVTRKMISTLFK